MCLIIQSILQEDSCLFFSPADVHEIHLYDIKYLCCATNTASRQLALQRFEDNCFYDFFFAFQTLVYRCVWFGSVAVDSRHNFSARAPTHTGCVDRDLLSLPRLSVEVQSLFVSCPERPSALTSARAAKVT